MTIAAGDSVTVEYTARLDDGTVFDTTRESVAEETGLAEAHADREYLPMTVEVGQGRVIEGLEEALIGLEEDATHRVTIPPEKAFGHWDEENVRDFQADEFSQLVDGQQPEEGAYIETQEGDLAELVHVDEELVKVDFNHELAGETLEFEVEVVEVNGS